MPTMESRLMIYCGDEPFCSVQLYPEFTLSSRDTPFLSASSKMDETAPLWPCHQSMCQAVSGTTRNYINISNVIILHSGGLKTGESGSQAIKTLKAYIPSRSIPTSHATITSNFWLGVRPKNHQIPDEMVSTHALEGN